MKTSDHREVLLADVRYAELILENLSEKAALPKPQARPVCETDFFPSDVYRSYINAAGKESRFPAENAFFHNSAKMYIDKTNALCDNNSVFEFLFLRQGLWSRNRAGVRLRVVWETKRPS